MGEGGLDIFAVTITLFFTVHKCVDFGTAQIKPFQTLTCQSYLIPLRSPTKIYRTHFLCTSFNTSICVFNTQKQMSSSPKADISKYEKLWLTIFVIHCTQAIKGKMFTFPP